MCTFAKFDFSYVPTLFHKNSNKKKKIDRWRKRERETMINGPLKSDS